MKPIDIKALAVEAGFIFWDNGWRAGKIDWSCDYDEELARFAELVAAVEREACARVCDELASRDELSNYYRVAARAIRARGDA